LWLYPMTPKRVIIGAADGAAADGTVAAAKFPTDVVGWRLRRPAAHAETAVV
jgi:hypothetical protein